MADLGFEIRELTATDVAALAEAYQRNREHLAPWDPYRPPSFYTLPGQTEVVGRQLEAVRAGTLLAWVLTDGAAILGRVSLNNIVRGPFCSTSIGYWVDVGHLGRGLASAAVEFACDRARQSGLHRVEASTLVHNQGSQAVLARAGFELYGTASRYLHIAGRWQDHRLYQRILHDGPPPELQPMGLSEAATPS